MVPEQALREAIRCETGMGFGSESQWMLHRRRRFVMFIVDQGPKRYVIKLARRPEGNGQIEGEYRNLRALMLHNALRELLLSCPIPCGWGKYKGCAFTVQSRLPGSKRLLFEADSESAFENAVEWIACLHSRTWVELPLTYDSIAQEIFRAAGIDASIDALPADARHALESVFAGIATAVGEHRPAVFAHNDLTTANLLFDGDRLGVIDWGSASPTGFPFVDVAALAHHLLTKGKGIDAVEAFRLLVFNSGRHRGVRHGIRGYLSRVQCSTNLQRVLLTVYTVIQFLRALAERQPVRSGQTWACLKMLQRNKYALPQF